MEGKDAMVSKRWLSAPDATCAYAHTRTHAEHQPEIIEKTMRRRKVRDQTRGMIDDASKQMPIELKIVDSRESSGNCGRRGARLEVTQRTGSVVTAATAGAVPQVRKY